MYHILHHRDRNTVYHISHHRDRNRVNHISHHRDRNTVYQISHHRDRTTVYHIFHHSLDLHHSVSKLPTRLSLPDRFLRTSIWYLINQDYQLSVLLACVVFIGVIPSLGPCCQAVQMLSGGCHCCQCCHYVAGVTICQVLLL